MREFPFLLRLANVWAIISPCSSFSIIGKSTSSAVLTTGRARLQISTRSRPTCFSHGRKVSFVPARMQAASLPELDQIDGVAITHRYITVAADVTLHVVEAWSSENAPAGIYSPTICLLHGFPDFWLGWRRQLPRLAQAGYRVICPDLRGYAKSSKPKGIERYSEVR
jgi:hypothetical protein